MKHSVLRWIPIIPILLPGLPLILTVEALSAQQTVTERKFTIPEAGQSLPDEGRSNAVSGFGIRKLD